MDADVGFLYRDAITLYSIKELQEGYMVHIFNNDMASTIGQSSNHG